MSLSRRQLLAALTGVTGALFLPDALAETVEPVGYGPWTYMTMGEATVGGDTRDIAVTRQRTVLGGYESEVVWIHPEYQGTLAVVSEANGVISVEVKGMYG